MVFSFFRKIKEDSERNKAIRDFRNENNLNKRKGRIQQLHTDKPFPKMICPTCKNRLALRKGPHGSFMGCSKFPMCRYTKKHF